MKVVTVTVTVCWPGIRFPVSLRVEHATTVGELAAHVLGDIGVEGDTSAFTLEARSIDSGSGLLLRRREPAEDELVDAVTLDTWSSRVDLYLVCSSPPPLPAPPPLPLRPPPPSLLAAARAAPGCADGEEAAAAGRLDDGALDEAMFLNVVAKGSHSGALEVHHAATSRWLPR